MQGHADLSLLAELNGPGFARNHAQTDPARSEVMGHPSRNLTQHTAKRLNPMTRRTLNFVAIAPMAFVLALHTISTAHAAASYNLPGASPKPSETHVSGLGLSASPGRYFTQRDIARSRGLRVTASDGRELLITKVTPRMGKRSNCKVHLPSVLDAAALKLGARQMPAGATIKVEIQAHNDDQGLVWCEGGGVGCEVTLKIPTSNHD